MRIRGLDTLTAGRIYPDTLEALTRIQKRALCRELAGGDPRDDLDVRELVDAYLMDDTERAVTRPKPLKPSVAKIRLDRDTSYAAEILRRRPMNSLQIRRILGWTRARFQRTILWLTRSVGYGVDVDSDTGKVFLYWRRPCA